MNQYAPLVATFRRILLVALLASNFGHQLHVLRYFERDLNCTLLALTFGHQRISWRLKLRLLL